MNRAEKENKVYPVTRVKKVNPESDRSKDRRVYPDRLDRSVRRERKVNVDLRDVPGHRDQMDLAVSREAKVPKDRWENQSLDRMVHRDHRDFQVRREIAEVLANRVRREIKDHRELKVAGDFRSQDHRELKDNEDPQDLTDHVVKITSHEVMKSVK